MKRAGFFLMMAVLALAAGCSRGGQRAADTGPDGTPSTAAAPEVAGRADGWTYQSKEHGFSLDLPSANWKPMTKRKFVADFWCPTATGSPMLAAVTAVKKQTREEFEASVPQFKADTAKAADYLQGPTFEEGRTGAGNPYIFVSAFEKGASGGRLMYVATAAVWLADKEVTVSTLFEGQGQMRSRVFKSIEYGEFEAAAKSICLSPR